MINKLNYIHTIEFYTAIKMNGLQLHIALLIVIVYFEKFDDVFCLLFVFLFVFCFFFLLHHMVCKISVPQPGIDPKPGAMNASSPNYWTAREFSICLMMNFTKML